MPIIGSGFFAVGTFLLFNSVLNYLPDAYPEYAASVLAGNDFMRSFFGAGFPLFAAAMYKNLGVNWASSLLGFLAICFIPIPFVLYRVSDFLDVPCAVSLKTCLVDGIPDTGLADCYSSMASKYERIVNTPDRTFRKKHRCTRHRTVSGAGSHLASGI